MAPPRLAVTSALPRSAAMRTAVSPGASENRSARNELSPTVHLVVSVALAGKKITESRIVSPARRCVVPGLEMMPGSQHSPIPKLPRSPKSKQPLASSIVAMGTHRVFRMAHDAVFQKPGSSASIRRRYVLSQFPETSDEMHPYSWQ